MYMRIYGMMIKTIDFKDEISSCYRVRLYSLMLDDYKVMCMYVHIYGMMIKTVDFKRRNFIMLPCPLNFLDVGCS